MAEKSRIGLILGAIAGAAASVAGCLATVKIVKEIKNDLQEVTLVSPSGKNIVTVNRGTSSSTVGITYIKLKAEDEDGRECELSFLAGKRSDKVSFSWRDDDHLDFQLGDEKHKQYCAVSFAGEDITMKYHLKKAEEKVEETTAE